MIKVVKVKPADGKLLMLDFSDGTRGTFDCSGILNGMGPMIVPLKDKDYFVKVFLENGAPTWPNGFDMAPWALHTQLKDAGLLTRTDADAAE